MPPTVKSPTGKAGSTLTLTVDVKMHTGTVFLVKDPAMNAYRLTDGQWSAARTYASLREDRRYACKVISPERGKTSADYQPAMITDCRPAD